MKVNRNFYEKEGVYGSYYTEGIKRFEKSLDFIKSAKPKKVLDAGCGDGFFAEKIKNMLQTEVFGVDISQGAIDAAIAKGITAKRVNLESNLPFDNEYFDLIYCGEVIEHVINPDKMLKEFNRILKKEGVLVLSTPNLACWYNRFLLLLGYQPVFAEVSTIHKNLGRMIISRFFEKSTKPVGHLHVFTLQATKDLLKLHGFEIEEVEGIPFLLNGFASIFDKIFSVSPSLATIMIIKSRKGDFDRNCVKNGK